MSFLLSHQGLHTSESQHSLSSILQCLPDLPLWIYTDLFAKCADNVLAALSLQIQLSPPTHYCRQSFNTVSSLGFPGPSLQLYLISSQMSYECFQHYVGGFSACLIYAMSTTLWLYQLHLLGFQRVRHHFTYLCRSKMWPAFGRGQV